ncbi:MAG: hypothetical protein EOL87_09005 [Spartobacteria bacterium]|nr:hypothetical protein [Spartobacteria bacterium]
MTTMEGNTTKPAAKLNISFRNLWTRILALLVAVIVWYAVMSVNSFQTQIDNIPVRILVNENWAVLEQTSDIIDLYFRGSKDDLLKLNREQISVIIDLRAEHKAGSMDIQLSEKNVKVPGGAKAIHFQPPVLTVRLDKKITRRLPVKLDIQGKPPVNFEVAKTTVDPMTAEISGPEKRITSLEWIKTEPVNISSHTRTFRERVELKSPSDNWKAVITPSRINAHVIITEHSETVTFTQIPIAAMAAPDTMGSISIVPPYVSVTVKASEGRLKELTSQDIRAYVTCEDLQLGSKYQLPIRLVLPEGIVLDNIEPDTASTMISTPAVGIVDEEMR